MDIRPSLALPQAGALRLIFDEGQIRAIDSNGRKYRLRAEHGTPMLAAQGSTGLTFDTQPNANDLLIIGSSAWAFVAGTPTANQIQIGANLAATQANIRTKINATADYAISAFTDNVAIVTAVAYGPVSVSVSISARGGNAFSSSSLTGGRYATEASAGDMMRDNQYLYVAITDIGKTATQGWSSAAIS